MTKDISQNLIKHTTDIFGLKYRPDLEPWISNDQDDGIFYERVQEEISPGVLKALKLALSELNSPKCIVEIGVHRNGDKSFTGVLFRDKPDDCTYIGIDINDKSFLNDNEKNIITIQVDSAEQERIREFILNTGCTKIDLLIIDGWHSINHAINDWRYSDLLSDNGIVAVHDCNTHPGPFALYEAVDENLFSKEIYCPSDDHGLAVFRRLP